MTIAIIGAGEVGLAWADALRAASLDLRVSDPAPRDAAREWAARNGFEIQSGAGPWLAEADLVLLCVPGGIVRNVIDGAQPHLGDGALVVDLSTAAPDAKRDAAAKLAVVGVGYVDVAITGAVAVHGVRTPLLCSGTMDERVTDLFARVGAPATVLADSAAGDAVRVKLLRSVIMKGIEALALESFPAAQRYGVLDQLLAALGDVDRSSFSALLQSMVTSHPVHAGRRYHEVVEASAQLEAAGLPHTLTDVVADRYAQTVQTVDRVGAPTTATFNGTLEWSLAVSSGEEARA